MSPFVIGAPSSSPLNAAEVPGNRDAPIVTYPAATIPFVRNARRLVGRFVLFSEFFIAFPLFPKIVFESFGPGISLSRLGLTLTPLHHQSLCLTSFRSRPRAPLNDEIDSQIGAYWPLRIICRRSRPSAARKSESYPRQNRLFRGPGVGRQSGRSENVARRRFGSAWLLLPQRRYL